MDECGRNNKEKLRKDIAEKIGITKVCLNRLKLRYHISNVLVLAISAITALVSLGTIFSNSQSEIITEIKILGSQTSLTINHISIIMLVINLLIITKPNNKSLLNDSDALESFIDKAQNYLNKNCPRDDKKEIDNIYFSIISIIDETDHYKYDSKYLHKQSQDIKIHKKRMVFRNIFLISGISLTSLIVIFFSFFGDLSFPYLLLFGIPFAYGTVMLDWYYYQFLLKKKGIVFNSPQFIEYVDFDEPDLEDEISCINNILRMLRSRYSSYLTGIEITAACFNAVSIVISVLDLTGLDLSLYFLLPFKLNNSFVICIFMFITFILTIVMKLFTERRWIGNIHKIDDIFKVQEIYKDNLKVKHKKFKEAVKNIDYLFSDIDKARGRHEFNIDAIEKSKENNEKVKINAQLIFTFQDRLLTHQPRLLFTVLMILLALFTIEIWICYDLFLFILSFIVYVLFVIGLSIGFKHYEMKKCRDWIEFEKEYHIQNYHNCFF